MAANFTEVTGFYVPVGSYDYPGSWGPNMPFGFDPNQQPDPVSGKMVPVYGASFSDVMNVFDTPITTTKKFVSNNTLNYLSSLTIQKPSDEFDSTLVGSDLPSDVWISVFKIIEYLYINQADPNLFATFHNNVVSLLGVTPLPYVNNSLTIGDRNGWRIQDVSFTMNFGSANDDVPFKIYFNPDKLIEKETKNRYQVYLYEDQTTPVPDNLISENEWRAQIVEKHLQIFNTGHYKTYEYKSTKYVYNDGTGDKFTQHLFIVYLISNVFTTEEVILKIKDYLLTSIRPSLNRPYTYQECVYHYPELFTERTINLYPVHNVDATQRYMSPVTMQIMSDTLAIKWGLELKDNNFKNAEVIYVGNETINSTNVVPFPIIAASSNKSDSLRPIGTVFPEYGPLYKPFPGYTTARGHEIFHRLLYIATMIITNNLGKENAIVTSIPSSFSFFVTMNGSTINYIKFTLDSTEYIVNPMK